MASLSDVQNTIVSLIASTIYPEGTGSPSAANAVPCMIYAGWPLPAQLDADLADGKAHVSVYALPQEQNTTRFSSDWQQQSINSATLSLTVDGQNITVAGVIPDADNPHHLVLLINWKVYVYAVLPSDTLASIAAALLALVSVDFPSASRSGAAITLPSTARIASARVGVVGVGIREVRRQERSFQITVWASSPDDRDSIADLLDQAFASVLFLTLPDNFLARFLYKSSPITDGMEKTGLYRRDFIYSVEYATTQTEVESQITQEQINIDAKRDGATAYTTISSIYI